MITEEKLLELEKASEPPRIDEKGRLVDGNGDMFFPPLEFSVRDVFTAAVSLRKQGFPAHIVREKMKEAFKEMGVID